MLRLQQQIRLRIQEENIDVMCEVTGRVAFTGISECRNQIVSVLEATVDEFLKDSKTVESGEDKDRGVYFTVAVSI